MARRLKLLILSIILTASIISGSVSCCGLFGVEEENAYQRDLTRRRREKKMIALHPKRILDFYVDGFRSMTTGRTLWKIILIKLFIIFAIIKLFFFPNYRNTHFKTDAERADHVLDMITQPVLNPK